jgi:hypothetical protein
MNGSVIEAKLLEVIELCRDLGVPGNELDDMAALAKAGEYGVALENLCTQLLEYDAAVPPVVFNTLETLGRGMGIDEKYWRRLATPPN